MMIAGGELIDQLYELLDLHPAGEDGPPLGLIDGVLTALALSPEPVAPDEWLPQLGFGLDAPFPRPGDAAQPIVSVRRARFDFAHASPARDVGRVSQRSIIDGCPLM